MKAVILVAIFVASASIAQARQTSDPRGARQKPAADAGVAEAYDQFLLAHRYESDDKIDEAIAAYKRAMALDPHAAEVPAELAGLYLRQNKAAEAISAGEQALAIDPADQEANRVLGLVYAAMAEGGREGAPKTQAAGRNDANVSKAIHHLEAAIAHPDGEPDPNVRATLSRLYLATGAYAKAIPLLTALVNQEPQWQDGPTLLAEAYAGSGKIHDGIAWLEERAGGDPRLLPTLADFYERERRWQDAADTYEKALQQTPRSAELRTRYASALLNTGGRDQLTKARDVLTDLVSSRTTDARALYLLSQAQRRLGDLPGAAATARKVIAQNGKSAWGYYALAEALEEQRQYQQVVDALAPAVAEFKPGPSSDTGFEAGLLLPHLGFAYQQLGQFDKAIASFEEARRLSPHEATLAAYLAEANLAAKRYEPAIDVSRSALAEHPDDLRLARIEARALRANGKPDDGIAILQGVVAKHEDDPSAYIALAQMYSDADRGANALQTLQTAQKKFPSDDGVAFELGAVLDKQKQYADAEAVFKQVLDRDPKNAAALNYLGYMLAERGERLDESVGLLKRALQIDPDNGSFLDSLGWAYFKADKLDLAEDNLHRAAEQLRTNSVIQDHYGEVLFKLGRYDAAITAWTRALAGDGDSIDRRDIDKKIRAAKQKIRK
jgi:tetratricopeptide (TPR) repeat protein